MSQTESQLVSPLRINFSTDSDDDARNCIPVFLRIKPLDEAVTSIKIIDDTTVETNHAFRANKKATYSRVFNGSATQEEVFEGTTAGLIKRFLHGANVMTFAYGVTSSGKTHTIIGSPTDPGMLPRMLEIIFRSCASRIDDSMPTYKPVMFGEVKEISDEDIDLLEDFKASLISKVKGHKSFDQFAFENLDSFFGASQETDSQLPDSANCSIWISIYDIYNEVITDLLGAGAKSKTKALNVGQDSEGRTFVKNLVQLPVYSADEAYSLLQFARQKLTVAKTKLNENSSRSHMVFNLRMVQWDGLIEPSVNQFVISDLAGSERQAKTGTSGVTLKQASAINNSLLVLGRCLEALRKKDKRIAAPFRDSKLTRMLNPFFTQGGYVSLIICINPSVTLQDETMDTIRFSAIASEIVQDPVKPLERLRQLRRLTLNSSGNSQMRVDYNADVERWQDAVIGTTLHDGVAFIELRADYFNAMARDILRAEKLLVANEEEIESWKKKLKESENSRENIRLMQLDQMKEQRNKFVQQKAELEAFHTETRQALVEGFEEEIRLYKEKYTKYREGYAKLKDHVNDKLWPEVCLFRERFGYLPEFPPKNTANEDEPLPENTIKYWQDKLQEKEAEFLSLKADSIVKDERIENLQKENDDQRRLFIATESECRDFRKESTALALKVSKLEEEAALLRRELESKETLIDELNDLKGTLREAEENREFIVAELQIQINTLTEEVTRLKAKRSESEAQARVKAVAQSARVRSRLLDSSAKTPSRRRAPSLASELTPSVATKTPRTPKTRRKETREER